MCAEISTVASSVHVLAHEWGQGKVCRGGVVSAVPVPPGLHREMSTVELSTEQVARLARHLAAGAGESRWPVVWTHSGTGPSLPRTLATGGAVPAHMPVITGTCIRHTDHTLDT